MRVRLGVLTDMVASMLDVELSQKEALLAEVNVPRRAELLLERLSAAAAETAPGRAAGSGFPPRFGLN